MNDRDMYATYLPDLAGYHIHPFTWVPFYTGKRYIWNNIIDVYDIINDHLL